MEKKRAILLSICGPTTYSLIRSLVSPKKATDYTFTELIEKVAKHFNPCPSATVQRYKCNLHCRQLGESVADYVAALCALSENCEFGDTLDDMLRDRLVWGIDDSKIQHRLLAKGSLTFVKALEIAQASELVTRDLEDLQAIGGGPTVNRVQGRSTGSTRPAQRGTVTCYMQVWGQPHSCPLSVQGQA